MDKLDKMRTDPAVCPAVKAQNVQYVLDFGNRSVHPGEILVPGLQELTEANGFNLVTPKATRSSIRSPAVPEP